MIRHYYETENFQWNYKVYVTEIDYTETPPQCKKYLAEQRSFYPDKCELVDYDKNGNQKIKTIVECNNDFIERSETDEGDYVRKVINDENGNELLSIAKDADNRVHQIDEYWYDFKGREIKARNWEEENDNVVFSYYDSNDILKKICEYNNGTLIKKGEFSKEKDCDIYCEYNSKGILLRVSKYYDSEDGLYDRVEEYDGSGQLINITNWERHKLNLVRKIETDGAGITIYEETFQYDKKNRNKIERRTDYRDGKIYKLTIREYIYYSNYLKHFE